MLEKKIKKVVVKRYYMSNSAEKVLAKFIMKYIETRKKKTDMCKEK